MTWREKRKEQQRKEIFIILENYHMKDNDELKTVINTFYKRFRKMKADKKYMFSNRYSNHFYYLRFMVPFKDFMEQGDYLSACNELIQFVYHGIYMQPEVRYNILEIIRNCGVLSDDI